MSHLRVFIQLRGRRLKSDSACLIETLKELQREAEQSPETWPEPPTETETEISHVHTVTSEQSSLHCHCCRQVHLSPSPAPPHHCGPQERCYLPPGDDAGGAEGQDVCILARVPPDVMVLAYFTAGVGLCDGRHHTVFSFSFNFSCIEFGYTHIWVNVKWPWAYQYCGTVNILYLVFGLHILLDCWCISFFTVCSFNCLLVFVGFGGTLVSV